MSSQPWAPGTELIIGSRGSALALWQARHVASILERRGHAVSIHTIKTIGDTVHDVPLAKIGDKGLFTKELDEAVLAGIVHLAVHSLKDLPTQLPQGIALAAVTERATPFDAFVAGPAFDGVLDDLPQGAVLTTSSLRREAQLRAWRPDLQIEPIRGNVDTRLAKLDASTWQGTILASAGLERLGLAHRIRERISPEIMLPAVGQGALGVVCAQGNDPLIRMLRDLLNDDASESATRAERAFLSAVEGGCTVPVGALGSVRGHEMFLDGCIASVNGRRVIRDGASGSIEQPEDLGRRLAGDLLPRGGSEILAEIRTAKA